MTDRQTTQNPPADAIIEEIHANRERYAKQFDYDVDAIFDDLEKKRQARAAKGAKFVTRPPRRPTHATGTHD